MALTMSVTSPHGPSNANGYVKIQSAQVDNRNKIVKYDVAHYWDQAARDDGKRPIEKKHFSKSFVETPAMGVNLIKECYVDLKTRNEPHDYTQATDN